MNAQKPEVSILIVSYNVCDLLAACLKSIKEKTFDITYELILVDSASTDNTVEHLYKNFPEVKVFACNENVGFPKGNNLAYKASSGKYIFMLNPDTELLTNAVKQLHDFLQSNDKIGLLGPKMLNTDGSLQRSIQRFITLDEIVAEVFYTHQFLWKQRSYLKDEITKPLQVEALSGAAMFCSRKLIDEIGFFDEKLFWTEDMDLCYRTHNAGYQNYYFPEAVIKHHVAQSGKKNLNVMVSRQLLTKINFFEKHHGKLASAVAKSARFAHIVSRVCLFAFLKIFNQRFNDKFNAYRYTLSQFINHKY